MINTLTGESFIKKRKELSQIYFIAKLVVKMIFKHMVRCDCLYLKTYLIFKVPFSEHRNDSFFEVGCYKRMNIQYNLPGFNLINNEGEPSFELISK